MNKERRYEGPDSVGRAYDAWTADGVLERYWGDHIHHGYYPKGRWRGVDFREAKIDLIERLLAWGAPDMGGGRVLDVGCGIGGSSRYLARRLGVSVDGVTLSPSQQLRAQELNQDGLPVTIHVADALALPFSENTYDLVWSLESGEHMPDKEVFLKEMARVLKPGGILLMATWCHRSQPPPLRRSEKRRLERIYQEWALPYFISIDAYRAMAEADGRLGGIRTGDWTRFVQPTWAHQIALGASDLPWLIRQGTAVVTRTLKDVRAVKDMIVGYRTGTIRYGLLRAEKASFQ